MPVVDIQQSDGPEGQVSSFVEACRPSWVLVNRLTVQCLGRKARGEIANGRVTHITGPEGEQIDDSRAVVDTFVRISKAHAEKNGAAEYRFSIWGPPELPTSKRKTVGPDIELHAQNIRFGEAEAPDGDVGLIREAGGLIKTASAAVHDMALSQGAIAGGYEALIRMQQGTMAAQAETIRAQSAQGAVANEYLFRKAELEVNARMQERAEDRQDQAAAARSAEMSAMTDKVMGGLGLIMEGVFKDRAEERAAREARENRPGPEPAASPPAPILSIPESLTALIAQITVEEQEKIQKALGKNMKTDKYQKRVEGTLLIWELFVGASKAKDDAAAKETLRNIDMADSPEEVAALGARFREMLTILGKPRGQTMYAILQRAGF